MGIEQLPDFAQEVMEDIFWDMHDVEMLRHVSMILEVGDKVESITKRWWTKY
jgi:hypothetical protein